MADHATYLGTRTFACLDGLRAMSIAAVVWHHACEPLAWPATSRGFLGVDLFFVISGFLIVTLLLRERDRTGRIDLPAFYMRRSLRILPLNIAVTCGLWAAAAWLPGGEAANIRAGAPWALLYLSNWIAVDGMLAVTWSLSAEEQFYLVWPALERWLRPAVPLLWLACLGTSLVLVLGHAHAGLFPWLPGMLAQTTFVPILLGVGLAHALHAPRHFARAARWLGHRAAAPLVLAALLAAASLPGADISGLPRLCLHVLFTLLVAACVVREDNGLRALLRAWPCARIGAVSYGIYLLHHIALHFVHKLAAKAPAWHPLLTFVCGLGLAWALAELSFRTFERFFLRLKDRWTR